MANNQDFTILLKVRADLNQALGGIRQLNTSIGGLKSAAAGIAGTLGVAFSVAGLLSFVKSTIDANDELGKLSKKVGVSTETLSALGAEARKAGVDVGEMQKAFVKLAQAATDSSGQGAKALQAMGIDLKQFLALKPDQQFDLVAQKFAGYQDGARKAALATVLFGKTGTDLIPLLDTVGNQGLDTIIRKAVEAGTAIGGDAVDASAKFNDALADMQKQLRSAVNDGLVQFTPYIEQLSELINDPEFQENFKAVANGIAQTGMAAIKAASDLVSFTREYAEFVAKMQSGAGAFDLPGMQVERDNIQAELAQRARHPIASRVNTFLAGTENNIVQNALEGGRPRIQSMSTQDLKARAAQLDRDILHANVAANANAKAQQLSIDNAAGDIVGGILGVGGKNEAPIVGDPQKGLDNAKAMAAALAQLQGHLASLKTQGLDPTASAWAQYNKTVADATDTAKKAGNTPAALDALKAVTAEAARIRDVALDKIAQQDKDAYEQLRRSLETPIEAKISDAKDKLDALNKALKDGAVNAKEYAEQFKRIGDKAFEGSKLPDYSGLAPHFGTSGEFARIGQASTELDKAYQEQKALNDAFHAQSLESEKDYLARSAALNEDYAAKKAQIQQAGNLLAIQQMTSNFDQAAALTGQAFGQQSGAYRLMFGLAKGAAIAQAMIALQQNIAESSKVGFPANIALMAGAFAQGMTIVANLRAIQMGGQGYAEGGLISGPGSATSDSIPARLSAGEYVVRAAAVNAYGVDLLQAINAQRFADGGLVAPAVSSPNLTMPRTPAFKLPAAANDGAGRAPAVNIKTVVAIGPDQLAEEILNTPTGTKLIVQHVGDNPRAIQGKWGR